jgi:hypothetical protein
VGNSPVLEYDEALAYASCAREFGDRRKSMTIDQPSPMLHQLYIDQFARPLRFLRILNIFIILFWIKVFGLFVVHVFTGYYSDFIELISHLIMVSSLGFSAWVGWRTMDVISTVTDPLIRFSYLTLGIVCFVLFLIVISLLITFIYDDTSEVSANLSSFESLASLSLYSFSLGALTLLAARSLKRLRRTKINKIGITVEELVRFLHPTSAEQTGWFTTFRGAKSPEVIRLFVIAVILFLLYSGIDVYMKFALETFTFDQLGSQPLPPEIRILNSARDPIFLGVCYFLLRARVKLQPTAESALSLDKRSPVLFLRSFVDDERVRFLFAQGALFDFSLEARLATHFFKTGPFIAVDSPKRTAAIGAARASLPDTEWQGTVVKWMGAARLIVLLVGLTPWVRWEMRQIMELGYTQKLIILMPELSRWKEFRLRLTHDFISATDNARKRLAVIRETFSGSPWEASINEPCVPEKIRSLMFGPEGQVTAVCAKSRSRDCYQLAALISEYLICKEQKTEVREAWIATTREGILRILARENPAPASAINQ